ncbi:tetratricopeptide-like helical domain-containing protein [Tanacetum coccineum]
MLRLNRGVVDRLIKENFKAYCDANKMDEAMLLYLEMNERGFKPNHDSYSIMICKLFRFAHSGEACKVLNDMRGQDISIYNFLIRAAFISKKRHTTMELFDDLSVKGVKPVLHTYTAMIAGFCREGLMKYAKHLFLKMEESGILLIDLT